ncbi:hypothetical protein G7074_23680 [Pedobacter sp. HDW13]|uniref:hypothetical protein n=1 Tax=unclassified Pedobacter TaxID=2628915 RepID=UPI000F5959E7|nr:MULTISPECIES: hypothetical protein [unclassified Pedobacter]QIL42003.1 hypothetical protein G7074_23680 [Pedobacter sp. HDW13]RQO64632.1 hypothetical protein DBR40_25315 [Pedobacter sp. KBW01]
MESIFLENNLKLSFEKLPHTIRLIISKNNEEWVCKKETLRKLFEFVNIDEAHIFKGRLQLIKINNHITLQVKSENISTILTKTFIEVLNKLK